MNETIIDLLPLNQGYNKKDLFIASYFIFWGILEFIISINEKSTISKIDFWLSIFIFIGGIVGLVYSLKQKKLVNEYKLKLSSNKIKYRTSKKNFASINVDNLKSIEVQLLNIYFNLKDGDVKVFPLGNLTYNKILQVKENINNFADKFNIQLK